jgi:fibronectin-binding autotransporter adhesin
MAARHWVGGNDVWNSTAGMKWSLTADGAGGQAVPTSSDDVYFDQTAAPTVTQSGTNAYNSLTVTTGQFTQSASGAAAGKTVTVNGGTLIETYGALNGGIFTVSSGTLTFQTNAHTNVGGFTISGGIVNININVSNSGIVWTHTGGTIQVASAATLSCYSFTTSGSTARTLTLTGSAHLTTNSFTYSGSNLTFNKNTSIITAGNTAGVAYTFAGNGLTFYDVILNNIASSASTNTTMTGANSFRNLTLIHSTSGTLGYGLTLAADITITNSIVITGAYYYLPILISSSSAGTARTITAAAVTITKTNFKDITWAGASSPLAASGEYYPVSGCTNIGLIVNRYYKGLAGNWGSENWYTTSGGSTKAIYPQILNDVYLDSLSKATSYTLTIAATALCHNLTITAPGTSGNVTLAGSSALTIYGNLAFYAGMIRTFTGTITFAGSGSQNLTLAGVTLASNITRSADAGGLILLDAYVNTGTMTVTGGASSADLDINDQDFNSGNVSISGTNSSIEFGTSQSISLTALSIGANASASLESAFIVLSGTGNLLTLNATSSISDNGSVIKITETSGTLKTINCGGKTIGNLWLAGRTFKFSTDVVISGYFKADYTVVAHAITVTAGKTITIAGDFNVNGISGTLISLVSASAGTPFYISHTGIPAQIGRYLSVQDSYALENNHWYAVYSTDVSGNDKWIFTNPTSQQVTII